MIKEKTFFGTLLCALFLLSSCAKNISSSEYAEDEVGAVKQTYRGVILNARRVKVNGSDSLEGNKLGLIGGGVAGAVGGSMIGKGHGSTLAALAGAAAGALGGAMAEKKLKEQEGVEYTVELRSGRIMTIVQGPEPRLQPGQAVLVMVGSKGRSRVVADQTGGQSYRSAPAYAPAPLSAAGSAHHQSVPAQSAPSQHQHHHAPTHYAPAPVQQGRQFNAIDGQHRDTYARDAEERRPAQTVIYSR